MIRSQNAALPALMFVLAALMFVLASCGSGGGGTALDAQNLQILPPQAPSQTASAFSSICMKRAGRQRGMLAAARKQGWTRTNKAALRGLGINTSQFEPLIGDNKSGPNKGDKGIYLLRKNAGRLLALRIEKEKGRNGAIETSCNLMSPTEQPDNIIANLQALVGTKPFKNEQTSTGKNRYIKWWYKRNGKKYEVWLYYTSKPNFLISFAGTTIRLTDRPL